MERQGHSVSTAASAAEGLALLETAGFDVILVDILMPDMNGIELLARLKAEPRWRAMPVIMISGLKEKKAVVRCISAGAEDYLEKPVDPVLLHSRVNASLERVRWQRREKEFLARIEYERDRADALLHAMLPAPVIRRLQEGETLIADRIDAATIIFADIVDFTPLVARTDPPLLLKQLAGIFSAFDDLAAKHGVEKIKTIGDAYMAVAGVPDASPDHPQRALSFARDLIGTMQGEVGQGLAIRVGLHSGPVIAGLVGRLRFVYDVWGEAVNLASRLESACRPGQVLISESTHELIKDRVRCRNVGEVTAKGFSRPIPVFEAQALKRNAGGKQRFVSVATTGFGLHMDLERIHNVDKNRILKALARSASDLKKRKTVALDFEAEGFALHVHSESLPDRDREKVLDVMGKAAAKIQQQVRL